MNIENKMFRVRELKDDDADSLFLLYSGSESSAKYISTLRHDSVEITRLKIVQWRKCYTDVKPRVVVFGVANRVNDQVFGLLVFVFHKKYAEIHFGISEQFSGQGIATELCKVGLKYLKSLGFIEVRTNPFIGHAASIRVLEKSGFSNYGTLVNYAEFPALGDGLFNCADMRINLEEG